MTARDSRDRGRCRRVRPSRPDGGGSDADDRRLGDCDGRLFGLFLVVAPVLGILTLVWLVGGYAIVFGAIMLVLAFRLRARHMRGASGTTR